MCTYILVGVVRAFTVVWLFNGVQIKVCIVSMINAFRLSFVS